MDEETLTNVFWGLFFIWFGCVAALNGGDFVTLLNGSVRDSALLGFGTGILLVGMNLARSAMRLGISALTLGLGAILAVFYGPQMLFNVDTPFLPTLLVIFGIALLIGAVRSRKIHGL